MWVHVRYFHYHYPVFYPINQTRRREVTRLELRPTPTRICFARIPNCKVSMPIFMDWFMALFLHKKRHLNELETRRLFIWSKGLVTLTMVFGHTFCTNTIGEIAEFCFYKFRVGTSSSLFCRILLNLFLSVFFFKSFRAPLF